MKKAQLVITALVMLFFVISCSKKTQPNTSRLVYGSDSSRTVNSTAAKVAASKKIKTKVPKVIVVNDNVASKTFDGRYYYDLDGHRYWRSNKDGKYYLYNKSMATDPNFRKP